MKLYRIKLKFRKWQQDIANRRVNKHSNFADRHTQLRNPNNRLVKRNIALAFWTEIEPNLVRSKLYAKKSIFDVRYSADLNFGHSIVTTPPLGRRSSLAFRRSGSPNTRVPS